MLKHNQPLNKESIPVFTSHPYFAQQLIRDRQERLRQISQHTHLRHEARRIRRQHHHKT